MDRLHLKAIFVLTLISFVIPFQQAYGEGLDFSTPVNLSNTTGASVKEQIAVAGSHVYVVWEEPDGKAARSDIFFTKSDDGGLTFADKINLSDSLGLSTFPKIAAIDDYLYVLWKDTIGFDDIYFVRSIDAGETFSDAINLSIVNIAGQAFNFPQLVSDGSNVYAVWSEYTGSGSSGIFFAQSDNNGASFTVTEISSPLSASYRPQIAVAGTNLYVVWVDGQGIKLVKSTNEGVSFGSSKLVLESPIGYPQLASSGSNVYVAGEGIDSAYTPTNFDILFRKSSDAGANFDDVVNISKTPDNSQAPLMKVAGDNVYVLWEDEGVLLFSRSNNGGDSFSPDLISNSVFTEGKDMVTIGNDVYIAYSNGHLELKHSTDGGATFAPYTLSTDTKKNGDDLSDRYVSLAALDSEIFVAWQDFSPGNFDIFFVKGSGSPIPPPPDSASITVRPATINLGDNVRIELCSGNKGLHVLDAQILDPNLNSFFDIFAEIDIAPDQCYEWDTATDFSGFLTQTAGTYIVRVDTDQTVLTSEFGVSFLVVPESPIGILALTASSLAAVGGFIVLRKKQGSRRPPSLGDSGI